MDDFLPLLQGYGPWVLIVGWMLKNFGPEVLRRRWDQANNKQARIYELFGQLTGLYERLFEVQEVTQHKIIAHGEVHVMALERLTAKIEDMSGAMDGLIKEVIELKDAVRKNGESRAR